MNTTKTPKTRLCALLMAGLLALALTACSGNGNQNASTPSTAPTPSAPATLTEEEYMDELDALNSAASNFVTVTQSAGTTISAASTTGDADAMREAVEEIRGTLTPFQEFAAIDNPPAEYAEAHAKIVEGCNGFVSSIDTYCTALISVIDGEDVDINAVTEEYTEATTNAATLMSEGLSMAQEVANG